MSDFVLDNLPVPATKTDKSGVPGTEDPLKWWAAADANKVSSYLGSVRDALVKGVVGATSVFNVRQYGAVNDGVTSASAAFAAAVTAAIANGGGVIYIPAAPLAYRLTSSWVLGTRFVDEAENTSVTDDYTLTPSFNTTAYNLTKLNPMISVIAEEGAVLWGDFNPSTETAIVNYAIPGVANKNDKLATIRGLTIVGQAGCVAGVVYPSGAPGTVPATKQIGFFAAGSPLHVSGLSFKELNRGLVLTGCYRSLTEKIHTFRTNEAVSQLGGNATVTRLLDMTYSYRNGLVVSGQGLEVELVETEESRVDIWVPNCDNINIKGTYLENTDNTVIAGEYSCRFGIESRKTAVNVPQGDYRTNDSFKVYQATTGGITGGGGGPTGTGTAITDGAVIWKYIKTLVSGSTQCVGIRGESFHASRSTGQHALFAGSQGKFDTCRFYITGTQNSWCDDGNCGGVLDFCAMPFDHSAPGGFGGFLVVNSQTGTLNRATGLSGAYLPDCVNYRTHDLTFSGDGYIANPLGYMPQDGERVYLVIRQDSVGFHSITFDGLWKGLETARARMGPNEVTRVAAVCTGSGQLHVVGTDAVSQNGVAPAVITGGTSKEEPGKVRITIPFSAFQAAALTKTLTIAVNTSGTFIKNVTDKVTAAFSGTAGTLGLKVGAGATADAYLLSHDATATGSHGGANADLGVELASATRGHPAGHYLAAVTNIQVTLTSSSGNLSGLTAGSVTITLNFEYMGG